MSNKLDKSEINILIIEDDLIIAEGLMENLRDLGYIYIEIVSDDKGVTHALKSYKPDLIISDIDLGKNKPTGIDLIEKHKLQNNSILIFLSAYDDSTYREKVTNLGSAYYLIKPVSMRQLDVAIDMAIRKAASIDNPVNQSAGLYCPAFAGNTFVFVKTPTKYEKIYIKDICVIEAKGAYSKINTDLKGYTISSNLGSFLDQIQASPSIIRCHKSFAISVDHIESFDQNSLYVSKGNQVMEIPISPTYRDDVMSRLPRIKSD